MDDIEEELVGPEEVIGVELKGDEVCNDDVPVEEGVVVDELEAGLAEVVRDELLEELKEELVVKLDVAEEAMNIDDDDEVVELVDGTVDEPLLVPVAQGLPGAISTAPMSSLFQSTPVLVSFSCWNVQFSFSAIL